jgi:hypothetical protein
MISTPYSAASATVPSRLTSADDDGIVVVRPDLRRMYAADHDQRRIGMAQAVEMRHEERLALRYDNAHREQRCFAAGAEKEIVKAPV